MTSRERVLKAVNHEVPDRVPIDLGGMKASGIAVSAYERLKHKLGIHTPTKVLDPRFMIAAVEDQVLRRLHADVVPLDLSMILSAIRPEHEWIPRRLFDGTPALFPPGTRIAEDANGGWTLLNADGTPSTFRMPRDGHYFDDMTFNRGTSIDPHKFRPVSDIPAEHLDVLGAYARALYDNTDYAILGWGFGVCFLGLSLITDRASNVTQGLPDEWMVMLMTEKETCHAMMDRSVEASIRCLSLVHEAVGDRCFAWGIAADDSGTQRGEFLRPSLWAEMIKPHYKKLCDWIHTDELRTGGLAASRNAFLPLPPPDHASAPLHSLPAPCAAHLAEAAAPAPPKRSRLKTNSPAAPPAPFLGIARREPTG